MRKAYKKMPTIDVNGYQLRTIKISDYLDMYAYGKKENVTKFLTWGPFDIEEEAKKSIKDIFYPRLKQGLPIGYAIVDQKNNKMIGTIDFHTKIKHKNGAEIGFVIDDEYWNQGIMTKCLCEMIKVGFDYLGYDVIHIKHLKENIASQKVIKKCGFKWIKSEPYLYEKKKNVIQDELIIYEMTKEDYYVNKQS